MSFYKANAIPLKSLTIGGYAELVPFNTILDEEEISINILDCKNIKLKLDIDKPSGHQYEIKDGGIQKDKSAFVKVFVDFPKNKLDESGKEKLKKVMGEVYGKTKKSFKPTTIA